jgi:HK97 gp10 family phage protein
MAKFSFKIPEEFLSKLATLENRCDEIIPKALDAGSDVVLDRVRTNLQSVVGGNTKTESRSTGELLKSLGKSPAKLDRNGVYNIKIGFADPRSDGKNNAMLANIIEYGKHGQPPRPFLKPAKKQSKKDCLKAMQEVLEREMGSI